MWDLTSQQRVGLKIRQDDESPRLEEEPGCVISITQAPRRQLLLHKSMKKISATDHVRERNAVFLLHPSDVHMYH